MYSIKRTKNFHFRHSFEQTERINNRLHNQTQPHPHTSDLNFILWSLLSHTYTSTYIFLSPPDTRHVYTHTNSNCKHTYNQAHYVGFVHIIQLHIPYDDYQRNIILLVHILIKSDTNYNSGLLTRLPEHFNVNSLIYTDVVKIVHVLSFIIWICSI